jgi:hypothetical protein
MRTKKNRGIWACPWYSWKVFNEYDLLKVIWKVLDRRCKRYSILNSFLSLETQLNYKKMILEGKIS